MFGWQCIDENIETALNNEEFNFYHLSTAPKQTHVCKTEEHHPLATHHTQEYDHYDIRAHRFNTEAKKEIYSSISVLFSRHRHGFGVLLFLSRP